MDLSIEVIVGIAVVVVGAAVAVLKIVAPKTKTLKDDKALDVLEKVEDLIDGDK